ncbi:hypothetical protein CXF59_00105 [Flavobacterium sp. ALD4]|nr:hypothetical protein CXF59_00105 [Flavobacterium sp. ALD4]
MWKSQGLYQYKPPCALFFTAIEEAVAVFRFYSSLQDKLSLNFGQISTKKKEIGLNTPFF